MNREVKKRKMNICQFIMSLFYKVPDTTNNEIGWGQFVYID
jgi:hypothetical protein